MPLPIKDEIKSNVYSGNNQSEEDGVFSLIHIERKVYLVIIYFYFGFD